VRHIIAIVAALGAVSCARAAEQAALASGKQKVSYCLGLNIGQGMKQEQVEIDIDAFVRGLSDALSGAKPALTEDEVRDALTAFQKDLRAKATERRSSEGAKAKEEGAAFLAANKKKEGVVTLPSGLQYKVLTEGKGKKPKATDTVVTHYRGTLINGTEFDSSRRRGEPATFPVNRVIPAWTEALQLMSIGSKWMLYVPSELGYGENGAGKVIGPNATLIFEVELLEIK